MVEKLIVFWLFWAATKEVARARADKTAEGRILKDFARHWLGSIARRDLRSLRFNLLAKNRNVDIVGPPGEFVSLEDSLEEIDKKNF